ncbi:hypothetical protein WA158_004806 [Blastocystis sp. Blastoise]
MQDSDYIFFVFSSSKERYSIQYRYIKRYEQSLLLTLANDKDKLDSNGCIHIDYKEDGFDMIISILKNNFEFPSSFTYNECLQLYDDLLFYNIENTKIWSTCKLFHQFEQLVSMIRKTQGTILCTDSMVESPVIDLFFSQSISINYINISLSHVMISMISHAIQSIECTNIVDITLKNCSLDDDCLIDLCSILEIENISLQRLNLSYTALCDSGCILLLNYIEMKVLKNIQEIDISFCHFHSGCLNIITNLIFTGILNIQTKINFSGNPVGEEALYKYISLYTSSLYTNNTTFLHNNLITLNFNDLFIYKKCMIQLSMCFETQKFMKITTLSLKNCNINSNTLSLLLHGLYNKKTQECNNNILHFYIDNNPIGDKGIDILSEYIQMGTFKTLLTLSMNNIEMTSISCLNFSSALDSDQLISLKHLYLSNNLLGEEGSSYIFESLENDIYDKIITLDMQNCSIGPVGIGMLSTCIQRNHLCSLEKLNLSKNKLNTKSLLPLLSYFYINKYKHIQEINLEGNRIGSKGLAGYFTAISLSNVNPVDLNITNTYIGNSGCLLLKKMFINYNSVHLRILDFRGGNITFLGCEALCSVILSGHVTNLQSLSLAYNTISDQGCILIISSIIHSSISLLNLNLTNTGITSKSLLYINDNPILSLTNLDLSGSMKARGVKRIRVFYLTVSNNPAQIAEENKNNHGNSPNEQSFNLDTILYRQPSETLLVSTFSFLRIIKIDNNPIGDEGIESLSLYINTYNMKLQELTMNNINMSEKGIKLFSDSLLSNHCNYLRILSINDNSIGENGFLYLYNSLLTICCPQLTHLYINRINIGTHHQKEIMDLSNNLPLLTIH